MIITRYLSFHKQYLCYVLYPCPFKSYLEHEAREQLDIMVEKGMHESYLLQKRIAVCEAAVLLETNERALKQIGPDALAFALDVLQKDNVKLPLRVEASIAQLACSRCMEKIGKAWGTGADQIMADFTKMWLPVSNDDPTDFDLLKPSYSSLIQKVALMGFSC